MPGATGTSVAEMERHVNELSDEVKQEVSEAINASARQSIRPYNTQVRKTTFIIDFQMLLFYSPDVS